MADNRTTLNDGLQMTDVTKGRTLVTEGRVQNGRTLPSATTTQATGSSPARPAAPKPMPTRNSNE
ncbi:hypothetical protein [Vibrio splendidus]|uniref:Uncharacterized protein n=1 Tax=Vibrio splendidus TaxID=29497 RepID=A0A2N7JJ24_VIBSP|nr:hypothetical protein [Vibrio splendidus]PMM40224.1 hypothetical protein BCT54_12625 [Vibrio splendidus]